MIPRVLVPIALLLVAVAMPFVANPFIVSVLTLAFALGILATSINLAGGYSGLIPLGQAGIMATSAYAVGLAATRLEVGFIPQIVIGIGVAVLVSILFGAMVMRTSGIQFLMVTLAQGMIIWGLSLRMYPVTGGENGLKGFERPPLFDGDIGFFYFALGALVLALAISWLVVRSPFGLALRALKDSESRLNMIGYNASFVKLYSFVLGGALAGIAGIVFAYYNRFVGPDSAGFLMSGKAVLMVLLGGTGTLLGPSLGAIIIVGIENVLSGYTARWPTVLGVLFIVAVLFARDGILVAAESLLTRAAGFLMKKPENPQDVQPDLTDEHARLH